MYSKSACRWIAVCTIFIMAIGAMPMATQAACVCDTTTTVKRTAITLSKLKTDYKSVIDKETAQYFKPLDEAIASVDKRLESGNITDKELKELSDTLSAVWNVCVRTAYRTFEMRFPDVPPMDIQMAVAYSSGYNDVNARLTAVNKKIMAELIRRDPKLKEIYPDLEKMID